MPGRLCEVFSIVCCWPKKMAKELLKYHCDQGFQSNTRAQQMPVLQQQTQLHNLIGKDSWTLFKLLQSNTGTSF